MIDLDGLKRINDTQGHLGGDRALCAMAEAIRGVRRKGLVAARYGGDEFVLAWRAEAEGTGQVERELAARRGKGKPHPPRPRADLIQLGRLLLPRH